jgi:hypothetical protein
VSADSPDVETDDRAYLDRVMAEIDREVRTRRAAGDLPARVERQLDELFLEHSPVAGRGGALDEALRMVDNAAFIDPVVPIDSKKSGGAVVKKGIRTLNLWYIGFVAHQVSQFAAATSRAFHLIDQRLADLGDRLDAQAVPSSPIVDPPGGAGPDAWWVPEAVAAMSGAGGRVLHAACGDGWLVRALVAKGVDAYGTDPRANLVEIGESGGADVRDEDLLDHLRAVEPAGLAGLLLGGVVDGMTVAQRQKLLEVVADRLAPESVLVVHSWSPAGWESAAAPVAADLAPGRPWRPATWETVLSQLGFEVRVFDGPSASDYLVAAVRGGGSPSR